MKSVVANNSVALRAVAFCTLLAFCAAISSSVFPPIAAAQEGAVQAAPVGPEVKINPAALEQSADAAAKDPSEHSVLELIVMSGDLGIAFMAVLGLLSLAALAIALERLFNLTRRKLLPPEFVRQLRGMVNQRNGELSQFKELCARFSSPISAIFKAGLLRAGRPLSEMEKSMEDAAAREMATLRSRVRPLGVMSGVAPLVGLLGTVVGMIMAFQTASTSGTGTDKAAMLAEGIYLALLTTAAGLFIAIPAMLLAAHFNTRSEKFMREIDEELMEAMPCLAQLERPAAAAAPDRSKPPAALVVS